MRWKFWIWVQRWHQMVGRLKEASMGLVVLILLLALLFGGLGFAIHWLWIVAVVFAIAWVAGFAFRSGEGRWYRW
jgi:phosphoglycerol transferase MdoB-like AlkP superfamily enzyme